MDLLYYKDDIIENRFISVEVRQDPYDSPIHAHDFLEIIYITKGHALHEHKGKRVPLSIGDFFFIDCGTKHRILEKSTDFEAITCTFVPEFIDKSLLRSVGILDVLRHECVNLSPYARVDFYFFQDNDKQILKLLHLMIYEYQLKKGGYLSFMRSCLIQLLILTMRRLDTALPTFDERITQIIEYIDTHYSERISLDALCHDFHCSLSNISILFKSQVGITYTEYLRRVRLRASCNLLTHTQENMETVASMVGYCDVRSYRKHFKEMYKISPLAFRKVYAAQPIGKLPERK